MLKISLIVTFGRPLANYGDELLLYFIAATVSVVIALYVDESKGKLAALVRFMYTGVLFSLFYRTTGGMMFLIFDQFLDYQLIWLEQAMYGLSPTLYIDQYLLNPIVIEVVSFCYFCYYVMIPGFLFTLLIRKDYEVLKHVITTAALIYFSSFLMFFLYPIEGPRWHFAGQYVNQIDGYLFRYLVEVVIDNGAVRGGCMPSSHTAIAIMIMMYCFKHYPVWGRILLPIVIGLSLGTFWGRFHYVTDVYVGIAIGFGAYYLMQNKYESWASREYKLSNEPELKADYAS